MPELPEVETVRKTLVPLIQGKVIENVQVYWDKIIQTPSVAEFCQALVGEEVVDVKRRGKYLIFELTHYQLISHLRMEGKYGLAKVGEPHTKHLHVVFTFKDGWELRYFDVRKFGRMALVPKGQAASYPGILKLGPEPFPETFDLPAFQAALQRSSKEIKPLLLEQKVVTGLGNIYVDEALWESKIHPLTPAKKMTHAEIKKLHQAIIDVLGRAIISGGTTIRSYHNAVGEAGHFQVELAVYGKTGEPCPRCQTAIEKIKVGGRGTHFCPHCQVLKG